MSIAAPVTYLGVGDGASPDFQDLRDEARYGFGRPNFQTRGQIIVPVHFRGDDSNTMAENYQRLARKLRQARKAWREHDRSKRVTFTWQPRTTDPVFFDVMGGDLTPLQINPNSQSGQCDMTLLVLPYPRGLPLTDVETAELTNGSAQFLRQRVPGDHPAFVKMTITDTSDTGVINRIRFGLRSEQEIAALGDFDPWVDAAVLSPGTLQADATRFGGTYIHNTTASTAWSNLARFTMPAGALNRGRRDLWALIYDVATAMAQPTGGAATVTPPTLSSSGSGTQYESLSIGATGVLRGVSAVAASAVLSQPTQVGSLLVGFGFSQDIGGEAIPTSVGGVWKLLINVAFNAESSNEMRLGVYYLRNATAAVSTVSWDGGTGSAGNPFVMHVIEILNGDLLIDVASASDSANVVELLGVQPGDTSFNNEAILAAFAIPSSSAAPMLDFWYGGYEEILDYGSMVTGWRVSVSPETPPPPRVRLLPTAPAMVNLAVNAKPKASTTTTTEVVEPTPGELRAGAYVFRVQAVDPLGVLSNASSNINATVTLDRSSIQLSWAAPTGTIAYYKITYTYGGRTYYFYTPDSSTSYLLTTTDGHPEADTLPATTGAAASPARLRFRIGTAGSASAILSETSDVPLTGAGAWRAVRVAGAKDLPPVGQQLNGDQPEWAIEAQIRSANGLDATVRIDAIWTVPHDEWQAVLEYPGLGLSTKRVWVTETDLSGRAMNGWLEDISIATEVGRISTAGVFMLEPGDNIIALLLEQADGDATLAASCTIQLTIIPRFDWMNGLLT